MASPVTLRLDEETRRRIARIARRKRLPASQVIRQGIAAWVDGQEATVSPHEAVADLIGVVDGANPSRSTDKGRQLTRLLKRRRRRS